MPKNTTELFGLLSFLAILALFLHSVWKFSRRFPNADVISVVIGATSLVPLVGAFVGVAIGALLILMLDPIKALLFVVFMLCLQQIEGNLIYPKIVGKAVGMPGLLVLCAVLVGGNIAGVLGALCAVPLTAMLYALLRESVERRERGQTAASDTQDVV